MSNNFDNEEFSNETDSEIVDVFNNIVDKKGVIKNPLEVRRRLEQVLEEKALEREINGDLYY